MKMGKGADAERAVEAKSRRGTVWRRLKEAGARANGLSGLSGEFDPGQAVSKRLARDVLDEAEAGAGVAAFLPVHPSLKEDDHARENGHAHDAGGEGPEHVRLVEAKPSGAHENDGENRPIGAAEGEGEDRFIEGKGAFDDWHWIEPGGYSLRVTAFSACVLMLASALAPGGFSTDGPALGVGMYFVWLAATFWAVCRGCGRGIAVVKERSGAVRFGLSAVALSFLWAGDPAAAGLAVWIAAAALAIGGLEDGDWIAVVSLRREVPPWRAVGIVFRESRDAWREGWRSLYGGTLR